MDAFFALAHYCEHHGPRIVFITDVFPKGITEAFHNNFQFENCSACYTLSGLLVTHDKDETNSYISSSVSLRNNNSKQMNQLALRVTSSENTIYEPTTLRRRNRTSQAGKLGALVFQDSLVNEGLVIGFVFTVNDSATRGFQRTYGIFGLLSNISLALSLTPFLLTSLKVIVIYIQEQISESFYKEEFPTVELRSLETLSGTFKLYEFLHNSFVSFLKTFKESYPVIPHLRYTSLVPSNYNQGFLLTELLDSYVSGEKMKESLVYLCFLGGSLTLTLFKNTNHILKALLSLCPPSSKIDVLPKHNDDDDNFGVIRGCSFEHHGILTPEGFTSSFSLPFPTPQIVLRALSILSKRHLPASVMDLRLQALRTEIIDLSKIRVLNSGNFSSLLLASNFVSTDEPIFRAWSSLT